MAEYTIYPLRLGTITRPVSNMLYGADDHSLFEFPVNAYYMESDEHKILVDSGPSYPNPERWQPHTRTPQEELTAQLDAIGVKPSDIDIVIFTHLHWDHAANNDKFPQARFIAQKAEVDLVKKAYANNETVKGYEVEFSGLYEYESLDGDTEVVPGVTAISAPGHSIGSQVLIVETAGGKYLITGDTVPRYGNWTAEPKIPNGSYDYFEPMVKSYEKLANLGIDRILPGHEPDVFNQKSYPETKGEKTW